MATKFQSSPSSLLLHLSLLLAILFTIPTSSTSRKSLQLQPHHHHQTIRVTLHHIDSAKNLSKFELVQKGIKRGNLRIQRLKAMVLSSSSPDSQIEAPIHAGNGEYLMKLSIGTPPSSFSAVLDTGSDLIWTQCKPCTQCYNQPTPIFDPKNSSSFSKLPCDAKLCSSLPSSSCSNGCQYVYTYGDYSMTQGILASETFTFGAETGDSVSVQKVGFGCGEDNEGDGFEQASGLVGLGRGPLSLISQMGEPKFSYCLTSMDDNSKTSTLFLGSVQSVSGNDETGEDVTVPLLTNPSKPSFYYLPLEGITVGDTQLSIEKSTFEVGDDGSGGMIIDSGTTITYIEHSAFEALKTEFVSQTQLQEDKSGNTGLDVCFTLPSGTNQVEIPKLVFHFKGGADLELPSENYMIADSDMGVACLAMGGSKGMSIFGNVQQQNMLVKHDLQKQTISFVPTQCHKL
ncbi:aspartic proteinase nepenthesin-1 [Senna tora]|uniref:Aspartic proteinase nepenthesin-1 n=1 Tax=Senna tora TaxID=362788 RepID=A0A834WWK2_9FABA|nr:aspartic proteinase nepenthesin-1 [Senna tora]